ncbi:MAG: ExbD/TolR family protein [Alphaproteobacteria bacterium]
MRARSIAGGRRLSGDEGVLPLINVVFLLLVFFMLAGTITTQDVLPIEPTASRSRAEPGDQDFVVLVGPAGELAVADRLLDDAALAGALAARLREAPEAPVWIKADSGTDAVHVVDVLDAARAAGAREVRLLTALGGG